MPLIFDLVLLVIGIFWFCCAVFTLPLWNGMSIAGGMIPAVASGILIVLLVVRIVKLIRTEKIDRAYFRRTFHEVDWRSLIPLVIGLLVLIGIQLVGMLISLTVMLFCWLKFLSGYSLKKSFLITICVMAVLYGIFKLWLVVPLPKGLLDLI